MQVLNGFVKIHRKLIQWGWYQDNVVKGVFLHLLLTASFRDSEWMGRTIKKGQVVVGIQKMADELGFTRQQVRTAINKLKSTNEITTETTNKFTIVTVVNWEEYQSSEDLATNEITNTLTIEQPTINQQITNNQPHLKNVKNDKNDNNPPLSSPPLSEILHRSGYERLEDDDEKNYFKRAIESLWNTKSRSVNGKRLSEADIKHYLESISFDIIQTISDRVNFYDIKNPVNYLKTALLKELTGNTDTSSQSGNNKLNHFGDMDYDSLDKKVVEKMINRAKKQ